MEPDYFPYLLGSLIANVILMFLLTSPNAVRFIHQHYLIWKPKYDRKRMKKAIRTITSQQAWEYGMIPKKEKYAIINTETKTIVIGGETEKNVRDVLQMMGPEHPLWEKIELVKTADL